MQEPLPTPNSTVTCSYSPENTWQVRLCEQLSRAASTALPKSSGAGGKHTFMKRKAGSQRPRNFERAEILLQLAVHILRGRSPRSKNSLQLRMRLNHRWQTWQPCRGWSEDPTFSAWTRWLCRAHTRPAGSNIQPQAWYLHHIKLGGASPGRLLQHAGSLVSAGCPAAGHAVPDNPVMLPPAHQMASKRSFCQLLSSAQSTWNAIFPDATERHFKSTPSFAFWGMKGHERTCKLSMKTSKCWRAATSATVPNCHLCCLAS